MDVLWAAPGRPAADAADPVAQLANTPLICALLTAGLAFLAGLARSRTVDRHPA
ncbi:hypothetical protein [Streptomyces sp. YGL11-2]|uniref:hypothetical protein n=1 Tax=Streptomyces sp. YGL11-2 TaxID=3414028 RepID=UPI003CF0D3F6